MIANVTLSPKQGQALKKLLDSIIEFILYGGGANGGKSWIGCLWLIMLCLKYPGTRYFIGRESLKKIRESTFITFQKVCKYYKICRTEWNYNGQDSFIEFSNGSRIDFLDLRYLPSDPLFERYGSIEYTSGWIEEGGEVHFDAFDTLKSRINRHMNDEYGIIGKIFITCNPKKNWMYHGFYKPWKFGNLAANRAFIQALVGDNIFRAKDAIKKLHEIENEAKKQRLLFGNWDYDDDPEQLINFLWIEEAFEVELIPGKRIMSVDVARYGDDSTTFGHGSGNVFEEIEAFQKLSITNTANKTMQRINDRVIDADNVGIDAVGLGAGVVDILDDKGFMTKEIISGEKAMDHPKLKKYSFTNLRSQMWWVAREMLRNKEVRLDKGARAAKLLEDLTAPRYEIRGDKQIKVESKDEIKKRIGRSTDYGDAFVYWCWLRFLNQYKRPIGYSSLDSGRAGW